MRMNAVLMAAGIATATACGQQSAAVHTTPTRVDTTVVGAPRADVGSVHGPVVRTPGADPRSGSGSTRTPKTVETTVVRLPPASVSSVHGLVVRAPGIDPRSGSGGTSGNGSQPVSGDPITARDETGQTVARAVSAPDGSFVIALAPRIYTVGEDTCGVRARVEVRGGSTATLILTVPNSC
jgi:hypothetical protein